MKIYLSRGKHDPEIGVSLPTTPDEVRAAITELDEYSASTVPVRIVGAPCPVPNLAQYIACAGLEQAADIQKLNSLDEMIAGMNAKEHLIFSGALDAESVSGLDDVLRIAASLNQYQFIEGVTCDKELGGWLVEHGLAGVDFPQAVRPYLDYAGIGGSYYANHGGAYTPNGYVKRREIDQTQAAENKSKLTIELISGSRICRLDLPASEDELAQAKQVLDVSELCDEMIFAIENGYLWSDKLPTDDITLDGINTLAEYVLQMSENELKLYGAALEVEEPFTFADAVCIAENLDDYELVTGSEGEYGREALRYAGAGDEIQEMLEGFTDFDALGRFEMEQDGVRETSYGQIKRLSSPFPQPEAGQTMY